MKFSIIVPVYNVEKYLPKCLESLVRQKGNFHYEIIVVNDGSPDQSEKIILEYKEKFHDLIKYIKKENGGISSARNAGLKEAKGEYILFVDSDDFVEQNLLEKIMEQNNNYDLFIYSYQNVYENNHSIEIKKCIEQSQLVSKVESLPLFFENEAVRGYVWNKVFKNSLIQENKICFNEATKHIEDLEFVIHYLSYCNKIYFSNSILYNYLQRNGSLVNSTFNKGKLTALTAYENAIPLIENLRKDYLPTYYYFIFELNYELSIRLRISDQYRDSQDIYKQLKNNMKRYLHDFIFKNVKFKYKLKAVIKYYFYNITLLKHRK